MTTSVIRCAIRFDVMWCNNDVCDVHHQNVMWCVIRCVIFQEVLPLTDYSHVCGSMLQKCLQVGCLYSAMYSTKMNWESNGLNLAAAISAIQFENLPLTYIVCDDLALKLKTVQNRLNFDMWTSLYLRNIALYLFCWVPLPFQGKV